MAEFCYGRRQERCVVSRGEKVIKYYTYESNSYPTLQRNQK